MEMYEILVPTVRNDGRPIRKRFHKVWDAKVREIAGGLTILSPTKGQWIDKQGKLFAERMIPVRIACERDQIDLIADFTAKYYEQAAILFYRVSEQVWLKQYDPQRRFRPLIGKRV